MLGWIFNRTPREPSADNRAAQVRRGILGQALRAGRDTDPEGYSLERKHRAHHPRGWGSSGDDDRNAGEDITRRRIR